jgi:paraquat-inducible protein B
MSEDASASAQPEVRRSRFSLVWLVPILAVGLGGYLGWRTLSEKGPVITIYFETADGLEAGKTKVKYKAVDIGVVQSIDVRDESPQIVVQAALDKGAEGHVRKDTLFWVVRPRIGFGGVSGLGTLLSGDYINMFPGPKDGPSERTFTGLNYPPLSPPHMGLKIVLVSPTLSSLNPGAPIYFRQLRVGRVEGHRLAEDGKHIEVDALIEAEHAGRVHTNSRFWNAGGLHLEAGLGKIELHSESIEAMLGGGVSFDSPAGGKPAEAGARFVLHDSRAELKNAAWLYGGLHVVVEAPALGGVKPGDFVLYREERVGAVVSHSLSTDSRTVRIHLNILSRYATLVRNNSVFWNAGGVTADLGLTGLHMHMESLEALLAGGIAFATPDKPGGRVKAGSVFKLHPEVKDDWLKWRPLLWRGPANKHPGGAAAKKEEKHGFFHHGDKSEEQTVVDGPKPAAEDEEKHGFFDRFRRNKDEDKDKD